MKRSTLFSLISIFLLLPATLYLGTQLSGKAYYITSTLVILETMLPFFFRFESRKPQARELAAIAVMCALAVAGRVAFPLPNFKAITGIVMIAGIAFGAETGFMIGAVSAFASNFFFSQGPWTPWQMMAYGMAGFLSGLIFHRHCKKLLKNTPLLLGLMSVFGFVGIVVVIGPLLDCSTIFATSSHLSWKYALAVLAAGLPHNVTHGISCALTLVIFSKPLLSKLSRLQTKYGMLS